MTDLGLRKRIFALLWVTFFYAARVLLSYVNHYGYYTKSPASATKREAEAFWM